MERAILVAAPRRRSPDALQSDEHLEELARLADTAGAEIVGRVKQSIQAPTPRYYIGQGKVAELKAIAEQSGATLVVFDEQLSPAQGKALEAALELRVMDRAELILDIFATRARSNEAKMQVELAQLEYLLPRLARMWVHLSRIRGGIGLRGPGETQIETDRRMIRRRISTLKKKLDRVEQHRATLRQHRHHVPTAVLVGYTNTGKSSLLKALSGADAFIEDRLFATLDTLTREVVLNGAASGSGPRLRLVDTVGFIRKLPHHLVASFRATLEEVRRAELLLHVIDAAHRDWEEQVGVVDEVLAGLSRDGTPVIHVFNKLDLLPDPDAFRAQVAHSFEHSAFVAARPGRVTELLVSLQRAVATDSHW